METQANTGRDFYKFDEFKENPEKVAKQQQNKIYGRNLQYPQTKPINIRPQTSDSTRENRRNHSVELEKKKSIADRTQKTRKMYERRASF